MCYLASTKSPSVDITIVNAAKNKNAFNYTYNLGHCIMNSHERTLNFHNIVRCALNFSNRALEAFNNSILRNNLYSDQHLYSSLALLFPENDPLPNALNNVAILADDDGPLSANYYDTHTRYIQSIHDLLHLLAPLAATAATTDDAE